tara:strand:- start:200 stop:454 length:255 start_codon:yes stop_codon:yes gene_type:complete
MASILTDKPKRYGSRGTIKTDKPDDTIFNPSDKEIEARNKAMWGQLANAVGQGGVGFRSPQPKQANSPKHNSEQKRSSLLRKGY